VRVGKLSWLLLMFNHAAMTAGRSNSLRRPGSSRSSEGKRSCAPQNLLRLSVGLEHPDYLVEDLPQAMT
jgi:cystathionine beta-lyase/cystathionine gamma-synthase